MFNLLIMIDLDKLQLEIDDLLESETNESILNWYINQSVAKYKKYLGEGDFYTLERENCHGKIIVDSRIIAAKLENGNEYADEKSSPYSDAA